jgi:hypothetical protein
MVNRLKKINPIKLDISHNPKITKISHMTNLRILYISGDNCGIDNEQIEKLNPIKCIRQSKNN